MMVRALGHAAKILGLELMYMVYKNCSEVFITMYAPDYGLVCPSKGQV